MASRRRPRTAPPPPPRDSVDAIVDGWRAVRDDLDVAPVEVVSRLTRIRAHMEQEMEGVFAEHGLTSATFSALAAIARLAGDAGVAQVELMRALGLTSGTISVRIDRLVADGLAARRPDPADGRGTRVTLTPAGRAAFERAAPAHLDNERRMLSPLSPDEQAQLAGLLRKLLLEFEGGAPAGDAAPRLGLVLASAPTTGRMRRDVGLPERPGLLVRSVERDGAAAAAGVEAGDVIVGAGGREVRSLVDLAAAVGAGPDALALRIVRGVRESEVTVALAATPGAAAPAAPCRRGEHSV